MSQQLKRATILITEEQHKKVMSAGVNLSGLIRDFLQDYFSSNKITIPVNSKTHELYQKVIVNGGASDSELEPKILEGLQQIVRHQIEQMKEIDQTIESEKNKGDSQ